MLQRYMLSPSSRHPNDGGSKHLYQTIKCYNPEGSHLQNTKFAAVRESDF
jgi:hypothetical protein